jgi:hypothetical protein
LGETMSKIDCYKCGENREPHAVLCKYCADTLISNESKSTYIYKEEIQGKPYVRISYVRSGSYGVSTIDSESIDDAKAIAKRIAKHGYKDDSPLGSDRVYEHIMPNTIEHIEIVLRKPTCECGRIVRIRGFNDEDGGARPGKHKR